ncbi:MAG: gas vesicle protein [Candidatus Rokubacteria bacterium]|nr:gas vesicle protein [Candidatus Rokubacteria bacterium]
MSRARGQPRAPGSAVEAEASLLDLVDNLLNKGVVITGELTLGLARIDLVYVQLSALIAAADRVLPSTREPRARTIEHPGTLAGWFRTPPPRAARRAPPMTRGTSRRPPITRTLGTIRTSATPRARGRG